MHRISYFSYPLSVRNILALRSILRLCDFYTPARNHRGTELQDVSTSVLGAQWWQSLKEQGGYFESIKEHFVCRRNTPWQDNTYNFLNCKLEGFGFHVLCSGMIFIVAPFNYRRFIMGMLVPLRLKRSLGIRAKNVKRTMA